VNDKQKTLVVVGMVCIALIMATQPIVNFGPFGGSDGPGASSPTPTYATFVNTPTPSPEYTTFTPTPRVSSPTPFLYLHMSPNPATQRDNVLGEIWSSLNSVQVTVHYTDGITYNSLVSVDGSGYGTFHIMLKTGSYSFWVTYGSLTSNTETLVVT
jgi:hypothetical protein